jgi:GNAT superfamily N-acetyltransferase
LLSIRLEQENHYPGVKQMTITIEEHNQKVLPEYDRIPSVFEVRTVLRAEPVAGGLNGIALLEEAIEEPYLKDYDSYEDGPPSAWPAQFEMGNWGILIARDPLGPVGNPPAGGAMIAYNTSGVNMLEDRSDLAVLWDIRVHPDYRGQGLGSALLERSAAWARQRGCKRLKIETQNVNVVACRFYASQGCELGMIHRYGYAGVPRVANEVMLVWYLHL